MYIQQDVVILMHMPHRSVDIYSREILLSNTIYINESEDIFLVGYFFGGNFSNLLCFFLVSL